MNSFWQTTLPKFPKLKQNLTVDVLIIGGGLTGLLCAEYLQKAGLSVAVAEAKTVAEGVSGRTTAKITSQHGVIYHKIEQKYGLEAARHYYTAQQEALDEFRRLADRLAFEYEECDAYVYSLDDHLALSAERSTLKRIGGKAEWERALLVNMPTAGVLKIPHQAHMNPLLLMRELSKNVPVYEHTRVRKIESNTALTDDGVTITARAMVVATHFPFLNRHGAYFLKLYQHRSYVVALENATVPSGMMWGDKQNSITLRQYGNYLLVGGGGHRTGKQGEGYKAAEAFAEKYFPNAKVKHRWATQDCMSLDGIPYIGRYAPSTPSMYVATGFGGWGMTSAMVSALLLTAEITGRPKQWASVFKPNRNIWHPQLAVNAVESTLGLLTPTAPRCPHLGCALKWNAEEHSWDCGCHGSRFAKDGMLLNGPSTGDLKSKKDR